MSVTTTTATTTKRRKRSSYYRNFKFTNRDKLGIMRDVLIKLDHHDGDPYLRTGSKLVQQARINESQSTEILKILLRCNFVEYLEKPSYHTNKLVRVYKITERGRILLIKIENLMKEFPFIKKMIDPNRPEPEILNEYYRNI